MKPPKHEQCPSNHDAWTLFLSVGLCTGLIISYLPQHIRIIMNKTSEGLSTWFLLLGATSSAAGMFNLLIMQWPLFQCCRVVSGGQCFESLLRFIQVGLQWLLFNIILILFVIYFPRKPSMRPLALQGWEDYGALQTAGTTGSAVDYDTPSPATAPAFRAKIAANKREWGIAKGVAWLVLLHFLVLGITSLVLLNHLPTTRPPHPTLKNLAQFCGISATALAVWQYAPQIWKTYHSRLVGALSIPTMCIQVPGSVLFSASIILAEDTDWTSWLPYAVTGAMQGFLLLICLLWKRRQAALGIDDFGNPVSEVGNGENAPLLNGSRY